MESTNWIDPQLTLMYIVCKPPKEYGRQVVGAVREQVVKVSAGCGGNYSVSKKYLRKGERVSKNQC